MPNESRGQRRRRESREAKQREAAKGRILKWLAVATLGVAILFGAHLLSQAPVGQERIEQVATGDISIPQQVEQILNFYAQELSAAGIIEKDQAVLETERASIQIHNYTDYLLNIEPLQGFLNACTNLTAQTRISMENQEGGVERSFVLPKFPDKDRYAATIFVIPDTFGKDHPVVEKYVAENGYDINELLGFTVDFYNYLEERPESIALVRVSGTDNRQDLETLAIELSQNCFQVGIEVEPNKFVGYTVGQEIFGNSVGRAVVHKALNPGISVQALCDDLEKRTITEPSRGRRTSLFPFCPFDLTMSFIEQLPQEPMLTK